MNELYEIATGEHLKERFEDARYIVTTRNMQQLKTCKQWNLIQSKYTELFSDLYRDIDPNTGAIMMYNVYDLEDVKKKRSCFVNQLYGKSKCIGVMPS